MQPVHPSCLCHQVPGNTVTTTDVLSHHIYLKRKLSYMKKFLLALFFLGAAFTGYSAGPVANGAPPVAEPGSASGPEDAAFITGAVSATDAENDPLTYSLVDDVDPAKGTLTFNENGTYSFVPV